MTEFDEKPEIMHIPKLYKNKTTSSKTRRRAGGRAPPLPTFALSHKVIRPNLLTLWPTYSYEVITIDNKLFSPTIKTSYEV